MGSGRTALALALMVPLAMAPLPTGAQDRAQAADDEMLNTPSVAAWDVYGAGQRHALREDAGVQGGGALRIEVTQVPEKPWEIGATTPIRGTVAKGDRLVLAFWARVVEGDGSVPIPTMIQLGSPPYSPIVAGRVTLGPEWKLVSIDGVAAEDHAAGTASVALQLGGAERTIDLGPAFVMRIASAS